MRSEQNKGWLVFIDTNIWLDFYSLPGASLRSLLAKFSKHRESIITSRQLLMEFLKNRQKAILEGIGKLKNQRLDSLPTLQFIADNPKITEWNKQVEHLNSLKKEIVLEAEDILSNPIDKDPIYKALIDITESNANLHLCTKTSTKTSYQTIYQRAQERFQLGYPPRKNSDTSYGDAFHWEWIVECAEQSESNILIVSRDGDFGRDDKKNPILNDWLNREFKERVGSHLNIEYTGKHTVALDKLDEVVSEEDKEQEEEILEDTGYGKTPTYKPLDPDVLDIYIRTVQANRERQHKELEKIRREFETQILGTKKKTRH